VELEPASDSRSRRLTLTSWRIQFYVIDPSLSPGYGRGQAVLRGWIRRKSAFGEYNPCSFHRLSLSSRLGRAAGTFKACSRNQLVYLAHWQSLDRNIPDLQFGLYRQGYSEGYLTQSISFVGRVRWICRVASAESDSPSVESGTQGHVRQAGVDS
jgi:hypothetical protein